MPSLLTLSDGAGLIAPALVSGEAPLPIAVFALVTVATFHARGVYRRPLRVSILDKLPEMLACLLCSGCVVGFAFGLFGSGLGLPTYAGLAILGVMCELALHSAGNALLRGTRARGRRDVQNALLLGGGRISAQIARTLAADPAYGLKVVGFIDTNPLAPTSAWTAPYLGGLIHVRDLIDELDVRVLIVSFGSDRESSLVDILRTAEQRNLDVYVVPRLFETFGVTGKTNHIGAVPLVRLRQFSAHSWSRKLKRPLDIGLSLLALLLTGPLMLAAAAAVRWEGGRGVLFRQTRIGLAGEPFELLKFRSIRAPDQEARTVWSVAHDDRVGPVGRFLRRTGLDELPQLWNVIRGDMSLVGPRPERPHFVELFSCTDPSYLNRHRVLGGITGLAQVNGLRGDTSIPDRIRYDNYYIQNWSLWLDVKIMLYSAREIVRARGR
jgi:exopolysaccharide biosynthesis polyprenyl glycosylphosphotransferase